MRGQALSAAWVRYEGEFELAWLGEGERVMSAGDGTGAAIIVSADGNERRVNIGDEIPAKSGPGQAPSFLSRRPASETETAGASSSAAQRRVWRGVPAVHATVYRDDEGNEIIGSRGEWMLLAGESVCGPFRTFSEAKQYVEDNDV